MTISSLLSTIETPWWLPMARCKMGRERGNFIILHLNYLSKSDE